MDQEIELRQSFKTQNEKQESKVQEGKYKSSSQMNNMYILLRKNYLIFTRNKTAMGFQILSPIFIIILLVLWQMLSDHVMGYQIINPTIKSVQKIPKCTEPQDCLTIGYHIIGQKEDWIDYVIDYVSLDNDLNRQRDVKMLSSGNPSNYLNYLIDNKNKTQIGIIFCTSSWPLFQNIEIPCQFEQNINQKLIFYSVIYNQSLLFQSPFINERPNYNPDEYALKLKLSIDNALINYFSGYKQLELNERLNVEFESYPLMADRWAKNFQIAARFGSLLYFLPFFLTLLQQVQEILNEKEKKQRIGISVMGMSHLSYWASQYITSLVINSLVSLVLIFGGHLAQQQFFINSPFLLQFILFVTTSISFQIMGYFVSTLCVNNKQGQSVIYGFLMASLVMQFFFSDIFICYFFNLHRLDQFWWIYIIRFLFSLYPPYHYSMIYGNISQKAETHFSVQYNAWIPGTSYQWSDLFKRIEGKLFREDSQYSIPSNLESFIYLLLNNCLFILLTWYFDNVLESNRGIPQDPLFFIKNFQSWIKQLIKKPQEYNQMNNEINALSKREDQDISSYQEQQRTIQNFNNQVKIQGIRILQLNLTYIKNQIFQPKYTVKAINNLSFESHQGELLGILGHNGAGKSSLIGVLTGILKPSSGNAYINDLNIQNQTEEIRNIIGVCPQFDILWDLLTAYEHMLMFGQLKNINSIVLDGHIQDLLNEVKISFMSFKVDLQKVQHQMVKTFSGGMKRRLSLAISAIGNPKIIIMDEPTTGMDPKSRFKAWKVIQKLKKNKCIILTTHSMEEADALSDRIMVMVHGSLKCIGTSLYLKNEYGDGYRLALVSEIYNHKKLQVALSQIITQSKLVDISGLSLLYNVPNNQKDQLCDFLRIMEDNQQEDKFELRSIIQEWGISNPTLEEVFMKVTKTGLQ